MESDINDGSIVSIKVRNFMCHDHFEVLLNRNVNFIVGRNGSGKSAILNALVIGLGGRATATNRGTNITSFIKNDKNSATIEIKIKNNSPKAYQREKYGDYITIIRTITASGSSSYKVKYASGEEVPTTFDEIKAITLAHDIQVQNPISVLNQDDARSFHTSTPDKKYSLFRRATNLGQTENNYVQAQENCKKAANTLEKKKFACAELEKELIKWKTRYEKLQPQDEVEKLKQSLQDEYYWSEITELERETTAIQTHYDKEKAKIDKRAQKLSEMDQNFDSTTKAIEALKQQLDERSLQKTASEQQQSTLEAEASTVQASLRAAKQNRDKYAELLKREKRKVATLEKEIHDLGSGEAESRRSELEARAAAAAAALGEVQARLATAEHDAKQAQQNLAHAQALADQATERAQRQRNSLKQMQQQLRELESRGNDSLAVYGTNMSELCRRIKEASGDFSAPPRGPIGAYLKVKEKKWGGALEHIIGGNIQSFCVNESSDRRKLFAIMEKVYGNAPKPSVTCSKFLKRAHNVRETRVVAPGHVSALDALDVTDTVVTNFLIDNVGVEAVLLVPDHETAIRLSSNVENVPENCSKIVTLDSTEFHPAPNYRSYGGANRHSRFLHVSTAERQNQLQAEIQEAQASLRALEAEAQRLTVEANAARDLERAASRTLRALLGERQARHDAAQQATAALTHTQQPQHAVLVDELNISNEKLKTLEGQIAEMLAKEAEHQRKMDELDAALQMNKNRLREIKAECRSLSEEIDQEQMKVDREVTDRRTNEKLLREDRIKLTQVEVILADKRKVIAEKVETALQLCPRIENPRDKATVTKELKKTEQKLTELRSDTLSKAEVAEKLLEVETKYISIKNSLVRLEKFIENTKRTAKKHLNYCSQVQAHIARKVQCSFQTMLMLRGYSGRMDFNHGEAKLDIVCTGRESSATRHAASTSSLSGGERSYSTVAFIMALWDCVEVPFCFMDEFDVFMDEVNRKHVLELLIDHALQNKSRQFVFLTPQDASSVKASANISIHVMRAPRD